MKNIFKSRLYTALTLLLIILIIGVTGYMLLSGYSFVNALYMTIITMTTVGFGEVAPLADSEKIFTIFLILTSITVFGFTVSSFTEYIVSGQLFLNLKLKKVKKKISNLQGHTIVCGYGRNGRQAIQRLKIYNQKFVVVEKNKELIDELEFENTLQEILKEMGYEDDEEDLLPTIDVDELDDVSDEEMEQIIRDLEYASGGE